jgi:hypothetical protein
MLVHHLQEEALHSALRCPKTDTDRHHSAVTGRRSVQVTTEYRCQPERYE